MKNKKKKTKEKKRKPLFGCSNCDLKFSSWRARDKHNFIEHQPPKKTTEIAPNEEFNQTLLKGKRLEIGDVVWVNRKCVIIQITHTENSPDVDVILKTTKRLWAQKE